MLTKGVKKILVAILLVYILEFFYNLNIFALYTNSDFKIHQLLTYIFLHGSIEHILGNILILIIVSGDVERYLGYNKFIFIFLASGITGGLFQLAFGCSPVIGASGAIFGVALFYLLIPNKLSFFNVIKKLFIITMLFNEIYFFINPTSDNVAHLVHIGGGISGILYYIFNENKQKLTN
jgi:membrane associated rhomboid family serine protease